MQRRDFIRFGSLLVILPASRVLLGCGDGGQERTFTSSQNNAHRHTVRLEESTFSNPPSGGLQQDTSLDSGHQHTVSLSEAELAAIDRGETVTKQSSTDSGHSHGFTFSLA